jgi:hypothetical protein
MGESNRALVSKATIGVSTITGEGTGGLLNSEQAKQFIEYTTDETAFLKEIQTLEMAGPTRDLDFLSISARIIRRGVEATDPTAVNPLTTSKKQLATVEMILPADISFTVLEDNIERDSFQDTTARLLAGQFGNDLVDLAWNGDTADAGADQDFLKIDDGFIKIAKASSVVHKVDIGTSQDYKGTVFPALLAAMPNKWKRNKAELRLFCAPDVAEEYIEQLTARVTAWGDYLLQTGELPKYKNISLYPVEYVPTGFIMLTLRKNLATGIQRHITSDKERKPRRRVWEYTMTFRADAAQIVADDAVVIGYDL